MLSLFILSLNFIKKVTENKSSQNLILYLLLHNTILIGYNIYWILSKNREANYNA